ncbi:MAG: tetratricopeptide repeat protein [Myxococcales bacterium]|jgi:TolA-binding protein|nr:tetratricopeptide repeat protein [Myxococcales bacterium]
MDEFDEELREIKREIVESRGLVIKTNNLTSGLAADLKTITKRQQSFERVAFFNSAFAFLIFVGVVIGAVYVAWNARIESATRETKRSEDKAVKAEKELETLKDQLRERANAELAAAAFYELVRSGRRKEIIEGFAKLREQPLSRAELAVFTDAVERAKAELSVEAYQAGLDHARAGRLSEAAQQLEQSTKLASEGAHLPSAKLELARAYRRLNRQREAIPILSQLSETSPNPDVLDDATLLLAECLIDIQAYNDAKATLRSFVRRFPDSPLVNDAKMALANLNLKR